MIVFDDKQKELLKQLGISDNQEYTADNLLDIEEKVSRHLSFAGISDNEVNAVGRLCESILDIVIDAQ